MLTLFKITQFSSLTACLFLQITSVWAANDGPACYNKNHSIDTSVLLLQGPIVGGDTALNRHQRVPVQYVNKILIKTEQVSNNVCEKTQQYMSKLSRLESKIMAKLQRVNPAAVASVGQGQYSRYMTLIQAPPSSVQQTTYGSYVSGLDTVKTTLSFLKSNDGYLSNATSGYTQLSRASTQVELLEGRLNVSSQAAQYIQQRQQQLSQLLTQSGNIPSAIANTLNRYKEQCYYYKQQMQECKDAIGDKSKMEQKAVMILSQLPVYRNFISSHSILAGLFPQPSGYGTVAALKGLQTRSQMQALLQQKVSAGGQSGGQYMQQQMDQAQNELNSLKAKLLQFGSSGSAMDLPEGFQPSNEKTKSFLNRLEYGANIQFAQSSAYFPASALLGLTLGYKINDKSTAGIGLSYLAGMGSGWSDIRYSNQGLGFRSFMDWKIKNSYYAFGGYEMNYMSQFSSIADLKIQNAWQSSVLIGLEKKYKISTKVQGNIQFLFDLLYKQEIPQGQMFKFRLGYNF